MKLTKQRLIEIIREEYKSILNENRVRLSSMDINFQGSDKAQLLGMKGKMAISRQDAKGILSAIQKEFSIRG
jgi:aspartyl aminopeptidase